MNVRINADLREQFARAANREGLSLSMGVKLAMIAWMESRSSGTRG